MGCGAVRGSPAGAAEAPSDTPVRRAAPSPTEVQSPSPKTTTADTQQEDSDVRAPELKPRSYQGASVQPSGQGAASSFARLFRDYATAQGTQVTRPTSQPHYDPLMDEIFEVRSQESQSRCEPLVSPQYVTRAAEILNVDLLEEPWLVPPLKAMLGSLSHAYLQNRLEEELVVAQAMLAKERQESQVPCFLLPSGSAGSVDIATTPAAAALPELSKCEECGSEPFHYCPACEGCFCRACFERLHARGRRAEHPKLDLSMAGFRMRSNDTTQKQVVNVHWHPFHDDRGMRYYYNFQTHGSVRHLSRNELLWRPPPPLPLT